MGYISYECARTQSLMCIRFMPAQSCDLIRASDWRALYIARATRALYTRLVSLGPFSLRA